MLRFVEPMQCKKPKPSESPKLRAKRCARKLLTVLRKFARLINALTTLFALPTTGR